MAITQEVANSFKNELLTATHNFSSDTFKVALFSSSASLDKDTTVYSTTDEITGTGYTAGGQALSVAAGFPVLSGDEAGVDFDDEAFVSATFTCRGAMVYNSSQSDKAVFFLDFGNDVGPSAGTFTIIFPTLPILSLK